MDHLELEVDIASEYDNVEIVGIDDDSVPHHFLVFTTPSQDRYKIWHSGVVRDRPWRSGKLGDYNMVNNFAGHATLRMAIEWLKHLD